MALVFGTSGTCGLVAADNSAANNSACCSIRSRDEHVPVAAILSCGACASGVAVIAASAGMARSPPSTYSSSSSKLRHRQSIASGLVGQKARADMLQVPEAKLSLANWEGRTRSGRTR